MEGIAQRASALTAEQRDLVIEAQLKPHDFLAVLPIVTGAGGRVSDWRGAALTPGSDGRMVLASTEALWHQALEMLR